MSEPVRCALYVPQCEFRVVRSHRRGRRRSHLHRVVVARRGSPGAQRCDGRRTSSERGSPGPCRARSRSHPSTGGQDLTRIPGSNSESHSPRFWARSSGRRSLRSIAGRTQARTRQKRSRNSSAMPFGELAPLVAGKRYVIPQRWRNTVKGVRNAIRRRLGRTQSSGASQ